MKQKILLIFVCGLIACKNFTALAFTEFYCGSGGDNVSAGSTTTSSVYNTSNGGWDSGTGVFTPTDASTPDSSVSAGMWASVYIDAATTAVFVGRITAVGAGVNGTITVSLTAAAGVAPTTLANTRSIRVGGFWSGPAAANDFPLDLVNLNRLTNSTADRPRINFKNDKEYNISAVISLNANGPLRIEGMTTSAGDGGRANINGNGVGAAINLVSVAGNDIDVGNFIIRSNGTSSSASYGLSLAGNRGTVFRVTASNLRSAGIVATGTGITIAESEAFYCVLDNTAQRAGFESQNGTAILFLRCISYSNTTANASGFGITGSAQLLNCVSAGNGTNGLVLQSTSQKVVILNSDFYGNGGNGIELKGTAAVTSAAYIENCNFFNNAFYGISSQLGNSNMVGLLRYCAFGSGTAVNTLGDFLLGSTRSGGLEVQDGTCPIYTANSTPWAGPTSGDFRLRNVQAWHTGRGNFTQTSPYSGTIGYPDLGAAQHLGLTNGVTFFSVQ